MRHLARVFLALVAVALVLTAARIAATLLIPAPVIQAADAQAEIQVGTLVSRRDVRFPCGDGMCAGWLYSAPPGRPQPVVILGQGFAGTRDVALGRLAEGIAESGVAALVIDYRHFGASSGAPRQVIDVTTQLEDWAAAVAYVRTLKEIDSERIALWGSSLGAGHALITAARVAQVDAVIAMAPMVDTRLEGEAASLSIGAALRLLLTAWWDLYQAPFTGEAVTIPAMARKGEFAMLSDDAAYTAFATLADPDSSYRNEVAARSILFFDDYNPAVMAGNIDVPVLLIASRGDRFVPFSAVEAFAGAHPKTEIAEFAGDHFDIYTGDPARSALVEGLAFLSRLGFSASSQIETGDAM